MATKQRGKYRVQVSLSEQEYKLIRRLAFEMEVTVNECLRITTVRTAEELVKG